MRHFPVLAVALFVFCCHTTARAELIFDVTGTRGSGVTSWTFSGEDTLSFSKNYTAMGAADFTGFSNFVEDVTGLLNMMNVTVTNVTQSESRSVDEIALSDNAPLKTTDEIQVRFSGTSLPIASGDLIRFSGTAELPIDLDFVSAGGIPYEDMGGFHTVGLEARLTITEAVAVPEPSSFTLLAIAPGWLLARRWRRTRALMLC